MVWNRDQVRNEKIKKETQIDHEGCLNTHKVKQKLTKTKIHYPGDSKVFLPGGTDHQAWF